MTTNPRWGALHAPFKLNRDGDQLMLTGTTSRGARYFIDTLTYGPQSPDTALARLGSGGPWVASVPTPRLGNVVGAWQTLVQPDSFLLAFPTRVGASYTVEFKDSLNTPSWTALPAVQGLGLEVAIQQPLRPARFFRVREE